MKKILVRDVNRERRSSDSSSWKALYRRLRPWGSRQPVISVAALAAGSTGPRRRRRSLRVHLPRGKGGWPRPWCAWFSRARTFTSVREDDRSKHNRPTTTNACTRLLNYLSALSQSLSLFVSSPFGPFLRHPVPAASYPLLYASRALSPFSWFFTHSHTRTRAFVYEISRKLEWLSLHLVLEPWLVLRWDRYLDLTDQSSEAASVSQRVTDASELWIMPAIYPEEIIRKRSASWSPLVATLI